MSHYWVYSDSSQTEKTANLVLEGNSKLNQKIFSSTDEVKLEHTRFGELLGLTDSLELAGLSLVFKAHKSGKLKFDLKLILTNENTPIFFECLKSYSISKKDVFDFDFQAIKKAITKPIAPSYSSEELTLEFWERF